MLKIVFVKIFLFLPRILLFSGILSGSLTSYGQLVEIKRVEIPLRDEDNDEFNVIPYGNNGLLVLNSKTNNFGRDLDLHFIKYSSDLQLLWHGHFAPADGYHMVRYFDTEDYLFCLLKQDDKQDISILRLDIQSGDFIISEAKMLTRMDIEMFSVIRSKILIGGRYNDRPVVELINLFDQSAKVLPEIHANNIKLNNIEVNDELGQIYVLLKNTRNCKMNMKIFNYEGKIVRTDILGDKNKLPVNGKILKMPGGEFILAGNYADNCSDYSIGFYTYPINGNSDSHFYDFTDFSNYLNYMPEKRQVRMRARIDSKKNKGKDVKLRQRLLLHDPVPGRDGIILIGEIFYPEYKTYNSALYPIARNYRWGGSNYTSYNNFRYTHALICNFDVNGKLIWDNSVNLHDLQSRTLDQKVQLTQVKSRYAVAYPDEGLIKTVLIGPESDSEPLENLDLKKVENENIIETYDNELAAWYNHNFIAYGVQSVRPPDGLYTREVFYLNRLTYK